MIKPRIGIFCLHDGNSLNGRKFVTSPHINTLIEIYFKPCRDLLESRDATTIDRGNFALSSVKWQRLDDRRQNRPQSWNGSVVSMNISTLSQVLAIVHSQSIPQQRR